VTVIIFPNTTSGTGDQQFTGISLPNPFLNWIRNQVHRVTGDDPRTETIEGTINLLAKALLENDRALLDYITLLQSYVSVYQAVLNAIGPGVNNYHADNVVRGVHQDITLTINLEHQDSLVYQDTYILGNHDDYTYTGTHLDSGYHSDNTIVHSDYHSDHGDHQDASHGDRASSHSDHSDHSDLIHSDTHGDSVDPHQDSHSDHTDNVHYDQTTNHCDSHSDHIDILNSVHCDVLHLDHTDIVHGDIPHANVSHNDFTYHEDYLYHDDYWDHSDDRTICHADTWVYHNDLTEFNDYWNHSDYCL